MMNNEIKGICCEAKNCKYHDKSDNCLAGHITVGKRSATSSSDTACETFECAEGCNCQ